MKHLYYNIMIGCSPKAGVFHTPEGWNTIIENVGEPIENLNSLVLELKCGGYVDYMLSMGFVMAVSKRMKDLFERYGVDSSLMEFCPVMTVSEEYGNSTYYLLHFKRTFDCIDHHLTEYIGPEDEFPLRLVLDYNKVKGVSIFNTGTGFSFVIISDELRKAINREKMNVGIVMKPVECSNVPEELQKKGYACATSEPRKECLTFPNGKIW